MTKPPDGEPDNELEDEQPGSDSDSGSPPPPDGPSGIHWDEITGLGALRRSAMPDLNKITGLDALRRTAMPDWDRITGLDILRRTVMPDFDKITGLDALRRTAMPDWDKITGLDILRRTAGLSDFPRFGGADLSKIVGITDFARASAIDFGKIAGIAEFTRFPGLDYSKVSELGFGKIAGTTDFGKIAGLDFSKIAGVTEISRFGGVDFGRLFKDLDLNVDRFYPPNWPAGVDLDVATEVINDDGLPLVWVPRQEVVELLLAASDREARIKVLLSHTEELIEDCREVLDDIDEPSLAGQLPLAKQAVEVLAAGFGGSAQALATVVTETVVAAALSHKYTEVKKRVRFDPETVPWNRLRLAAALGPIDRFYTPWWPSSGTPSPKELSRHVTVHNADVTHYSPGNALVAVLLVTSVLRGIQELQEGAPSEEAA